MAFSIPKFNTNVVNQNGFLKPCHFAVAIAPPKALIGKQQFSQERIIYLCHSASLPGINLSTSDDRRYGIGGITKLPYDVVLDDIQLSFYVDAKEARSFDMLHDWVGSIIGQTHSFDKASGGGKLLPGVVNYKDQYATTIDIIAYQDGMTDTDGKIIKVTLYEAFPTTVSAISLDWGSGDDVMRVTASFTYRAFRIEVHDAGLILPIATTVNLPRGIQASTQSGRSPRLVVSKSSFPDRILNTGFSLDPGFGTRTSSGWSNYENPAYEIGMRNTIAMREARMSIKNSLSSALAPSIDGLFSNINVNGALQGLFSAVSSTAQLSILNGVNNLLNSASSQISSGISGKFSFP